MRLDGICHEKGGTGESRICTAFCLQVAATLLPSEVLIQLLELTRELRSAVMAFGAELCVVNPNTF